MNEFFIRELKAKISLSSLISRYIAVQTKGGKKIACCPFHKEKTPSFNVMDEKGFYHCFGCGANGDAISFMQEYLSLTFIDAIKELCILTGTTIPEIKPQNKELETKLDIIQATVDFMKNELLKSSNARSYLKKRNITNEIQNYFEICYGGTEKDGLYKLLKQTFSNSEIKESGVCIESSYDGKMFDRFSNRIIFPIHSHSGKIIAFSGRIFNNEEKVAKYINSPETEFFKKSEILYNFHNARKTKEKFVIVCEGFMDVIAFFKDDIKNVVAQMGTAFSNSHMTALTGRFDEIVFCLDSDNAGINSQKRIIEMLFATINGGKTFSFISTENAKDPDEYLQKYGKESLQLLTKKRISLHEHAWNLWKSDINFKNPENIIKLEKEIDDILSKNKDITIQKHYKYFFKSKIYEAKFQKNSNFVEISETKRVFLPFEESAIMFVYQYYNAIKKGCEDFIYEMEINFVHDKAKDIFTRALNGEDISNDIDNNFQINSIPKLNSIDDIKKYYIILYHTSLLHKINEEIQLNANNFEKMIFLAREKKEIQKILTENTL